jgi:hypothetical protein
MAQSITAKESGFLLFGLDLLRIIELTIEPHSMVRWALRWAERYANAVTSVK